MEEKGLLCSYLSTWLSHHSQEGCATFQYPSDSTFYVLVHVRTDLKVLKCRIYQAHTPRTLQAALCYPTHVLLKSSQPTPLEISMPEITVIPCVWTLQIHCNRPTTENCFQFTSKSLTDLAWLGYILYITEHNLSADLLTIHTGLRKSESMSTHRQQTSTLQRDLKLKAHEVDPHSLAHQLNSSSIRPKATIAIPMTSSIQIFFRKRKIHDLYWRQWVFLSLNWTLYKHLRYLSIMRVKNIKK